MASRKAVSPLASGGAGTIFEYRVAAVMLVHLLRHSHPPGLQVPVTRLGLQQRARGHLLDDVVVYGEPSPLCTEFQVKRSLSVTASDTEFVDVVTHALHVLRDRHEEVARGELALGLIASGETSALEQLEGLTEWTRAHADHGTLADVFVQGIVDRKLRSRLEHVQDAVAAAIERGGPDLGGVKRSAHAFLSALHVWRPSIAEDGSDYRAALDQLQSIADEFAVTPGTVFAHLVALAEDWGPRAGVVDAQSVRRQLARRGLRKASVDTSPASTEGVKIDVDAVVRGPIEALDLQGDLASADTLLAAGDAGAVDAFDAIAERLRVAQFLPHATFMLRRRAAALQAIGRDDEAVIARIGLAWDDLDRVRPWEAGFALHDATRPGGRPALTAPTERVRSAADAAVWVAKGAPLDRFIAAFDALEHDDHYVSRAAVFLAEEAIADNQPRILLDRRAELESIVRRASDGPDKLTRRHAVRLQMCLADATSEWIDLLRDVHRRQSRPIVAWAHARYGRHLALSGDGAGAQENYLEAIERASAEEMFDEAADWLYALRTVRFWYDTLARDEQHSLAQALRPHAKPSSLPGSPHTAELGLRGMLDEGKPAEALQRCLRWRWQAVVRACLTEELEAVRAIGTARRRQGEIELAIESYVRAGYGKEAAAAAGDLAEQPAHIDRGMLTSVPNSRAAAYSAAAAAADLLRDDEAKAWADQALEEIANGYPTSPMTSASPYLRGYDVVASMCELLSSEQQNRLLAIVEPGIDRPANQHRETDEATAKILLSLSPQRRGIAPLLARAIIADQCMAKIILRRTDVLAAHREALAESLASFAADNRYACMAIIQAGADPAVAVELAQVEVDRLLVPRKHDPNTLTGYAGAPEVATLASILDQETRNRFAFTMLERVLDQQEVDFSRWNDLAGLFNIADDIDQQTRSLIWPHIMRIARGEFDGGPISHIYADIKLWPLALKCAARLGPDPAQCVEIEQIGIGHLRTVDEPGKWEIVQALACLPPEHSRLDMGQCAVHPVAALRALAAIRWTKNPTVLTYDRAAELARDADYRVRRDLARALGGAPMGGDIAVILAHDVRRSIRTLVPSPAVTVANPEVADGSTPAQHE